MTTRSEAISEIFKRILQSNPSQTHCEADPQPVKTNAMITKVTVRPNPFHTVLTLEVTCEHNRHIIVRMFDEDNRIVKMFSWYLVKGTNVTAINELNNLNNGMFLLDVIDNEGNVLSSMKLTKE